MIREKSREVEFDRRIRDASAALSKHLNVPAGRRRERAAKHDRASALAILNGAKL